MGGSSINELYEFAPEFFPGPDSLRNPLTEFGALGESEFIDLRLSAQRSRVGVIIDVRGLGFGMSNTALLVLSGVGNIAWFNNDRQLPWQARRGGWEPATAVWTQRAAERITNAGQWASDAQNFDDDAAASVAHEAAKDEVPEYVLRFESLTVSCLSAQIYLGQVNGMDGPPPDMGEMSDRELIAGFPQWSSIMAVHQHHKFP